MAKPATKQWKTKTLWSVFPWFLWVQTRNWISLKYLRESFISADKTGAIDSITIINYYKTDRIWDIFYNNYELDSSFGQVSHKSVQFKVKNSLKFQWFLEIAYIYYEIEERKWCLRSWNVAILWLSREASAI